MLQGCSHGNSLPLRGSPVDPGLIGALIKNMTLARCPPRKFGSTAWLGSTVGIFPTGGSLLHDTYSGPLRAGAPTHAALDSKVSTP